MRQMPNLRYTARGLPHILHRRTRRVENLGGREALTIFDVHATFRPYQLKAISIAAIDVLVTSHRPISFACRYQLPSN